MEDKLTDRSDLVIRFMSGLYGFSKENAELVADYIIFDRLLILEEIEKPLREIIEFSEHDILCLCSQWRKGRPTKDGGYENLYGYGKNERWYQRGEEPICNCGLKEAIDTALQSIEKIKG